MLRSSSNLQKKPLKINKQNDGKLFSKQLTTQKDKTSIHMAIEDLDGGSSVGIPFTWKSQPGTPRIKHFRENPLPPLIPPPSYFYNSSKTPPKTPTKKHSRPGNLLSAIFSKRTCTRKPNFPLSPASSSSSSYSTLFNSAWYSVPSSPVTVSARKSCDSSRMSMNECESPVSNLCFGFGRGSNLRPRGYCASMIKALLRDA